MGTEGDRIGLVLVNVQEGIRWRTTMAMRRDAIVFNFKDFGCCLDFV